MQFEDNVLHPIPIVLRVKGLGLVHLLVLPLPEDITTLPTCAQLLVLLPELGSRV